MKIHFICRGNVYRSLIAEAYLKSLKINGIDVQSSGVVAKEYSKHNIPVIKLILDFLRQKGLEEFAKNHWDQLTQSRINTQDINIFMNQRVFNESKVSFILPKNSIIWNIDDIDEGDDIPTNNEELLQKIEQSYQNIKRRVDNLLPSL